MICSKCKNDGVKNSANGKDFYFCRTCRTEITLEETKGQEEQPLTQREIDDMFFDFYYVNKDSYLSIQQDYEQECLSISPHWSDKDE